MGSKFWKKVESYQENSKLTNISISLRIQMKFRNAISKLAIHSSFESLIMSGQSKKFEPLKRHGNHHMSLPDRCKRMSKAFPTSPFYHSIDVTIQKKQKKLKSINAHKHFSTKWYFLHNQLMFNINYRFQNFESEFSVQN